MRGSRSIVRRSGAVSIGALAAGAATLLLACSATPVTADRAEDAPPRPDLTPASGTVLTSVRGPVPAQAVGDPNDQPDVPADELGEILLVGDSVLVLVLDDLAGRIRATLHVDGADCRRLAQPVTGPCGGVPAGLEITSGIDAVAAARATRAGTPDAAVFVLANNATITRDDVAAAMDAASGIDHVWWVNARITGFGRQDENNRILAELADTDPRAGLIDWYAASDGEDWLADNVHPDDQGQAELAALIVDRLQCGCTG